MMLHEGQNLDVQQGSQHPGPAQQGPRGGPMARLGMARQVSVVPTEATDPEDPPDSVRRLPKFRARRAPTEGAIWSG